MYSFSRPNLSAREILSQIFAPPSPSIVDNVFHKPTRIENDLFHLVIIFMGIPYDIVSGMALLDDTRR
jgi:hypothetical protein